MYLKTVQGAPVAFFDPIDSEGVTKKGRISKEYIRDRKCILCHVQESRDNRHTVGVDTVDTRNLKGCSEKVRLIQVNSNHCEVAQDLIA